MSRSVRCRWVTSISFLASQLMEPGQGQTLMWCMQELGTLSLVDTGQISRMPFMSPPCTSCRLPGLGGTNDANIERSLWLKLAANAAINPVTALLEKPNSVILETEMERQIAQNCEEVAAVAKGVWEDQGLDSVCPSALEMQKFATETARQTANNRSSMLQDILAGRPTRNWLHQWMDCEESWRPPDWCAGKYSFWLIW